jgi:hypothetical protein
MVDDPPTPDMVGWLAWTGKNKEPDVYIIYRNEVTLGQEIAIIQICPYCIGF